MPAKPIRETIKDDLLIMLNSLMDDLCGAPAPTAVCRFLDCLTVQANHHILPSENIYMSDPDYKGHYRVLCRDNCRLEYHKSCWTAIKLQFQNIWKVPKLPTEKDFLGRECPTPDCAGTIVRVEVHDQHGDILPIEDNKLVRRIEEEERRRKEEERAKREEQLKARSKNDQKKKKKKKKSPTPDENINSKENVPIKTEPAIELDYSSNQVDYSKIDLSNATVVKKQRTVETEEEESNRRKKAKQKTVLSLDEFRGTSAVEVTPPLHSQFSF